MQTFEDYLIEKQILFNQGKKYGQIVFMAGGAGSGKGFAQKNFMEISKFKVRDVDEWKRAFMEISRIQRDSTDWEGNVNKKYLDKKGRLLGDLDLKNPEHVFALHMAVKKIGVKNKSLDLLLKDLNARHLPNILFDVTLKDMDDIEEVLPDLNKAGYDARNVHVVWVLTNYHVAVERNLSRSRVVPDDILLKTHEGAANTMYQLIRSKGVLGLDGGVHVILNNKENTIFYTDPEDEKGMRRGRRVDDSELDTGLGGVFRKKPAFPIIKDFTYITLKREGQPFYDQGEVNQQVLDWIKDNIPRTKETQHFWGGGDTNENNNHVEEEEMKTLKEFEQDLPEEKAVASLLKKNNPSQAIRLLKSKKLSAEGGLSYTVPAGVIIFQRSSGAIWLFDSKGNFLDKNELDSESSSLRQMTLDVDYEYVDFSVTGKDGEKLIWKENYQPSEDKFWWLKDNADKKRKPVNPTTKYSILKRK